MSKVKVGFAFLVFSLLLGCTSVGEGEVGFETIEGPGSAIDFIEAEELVISSQEDWMTLWQRLQEGVIPSVPAPEIDFSQRMVLAVFAGEKPTGGFTMAIKRVVKERGGLKVYVEEGSPPPGAMVTQVLTYPYHIVSIPRIDLPVEFIINKVGGKDV